MNKTKCCTQCIQKIHKTPWMTLVAFFLPIFAIIWVLRGWTYDYWVLLGHKGLVDTVPGWLNLTSIEAANILGKPYPALVTAVVIIPIIFLIISAIKASGRHREKNLHQAVKKHEKIIIEASDLNDMKRELTEIQNTLDRLTSKD